MIKGFFIVLALLVYVLSIQFGALKYLPYQQFAPGIFHENKFDLQWFLLFVPFVVLTSIVLPRSIEKPSDMFFLVVYLIVYLPAISFLSLASSVGEFESFLLAFSLTVGVLVISVPVWLNRAKVHEGDKEVRRWLLMFAYMGLIFCMIFLVSKYYSVMRVSSVDSLYQQRELGRADSWYVGYIQTYLAYFFSSVVLSIGLSRRVIVATSLGLSGFAVIFLITAERSTLMFPVLIFLMIKFIYLFRDAKVLVIYFLALSSLVIFAVSAFYEHNDFLNALGFYYFTRIIAVPGQFVVDYYNFFSSEGYTYLSHVKGFGFFVSVPDAYVKDVKWPALGWIVGERFHGINSNSNASFLAADGIAAFGLVGPIISSVFLSVYLLFLDGAARKVPKGIALASLFPLAFSLTNGSLFSAILSYGGFMFLLAFYFSGKIRGVAPSGAI